MSKLRILYVASEINPFLQTSEVANFVRALPQAMQEKEWKSEFWSQDLD